MIAISKLQTCGVGRTAEASTIIAWNAVETRLKLSVLDAIGRHKSYADFLHNYFIRTRFFLKRGPQLDRMIRTLTVIIAVPIVAFRSLKARFLENIWQSNNS